MILLQRNNKSSLNFSKVLNLREVTKSIKPASFKNTCRFLVLGMFLILQTSFSSSSDDLTNIHDFHTSLTEMRYNAKSKSFEISLRLFTDDLQKALLASNQNRKIVIENADKNDAFVEAYVRKYFAVINPKNQKIAFQYVGKENEGEATWVYLEMPVNESINGSRIQNITLFDMFDDQTNIVNLFFQNQKKSYLFNSKNKVFTIEI
jgi:hypothetical protein